MARHARYAVAAFAIVAAVVLAYRNVLFPPDASTLYPWGSDTWGHLIKVEFLRAQLAEGNYYPNVFPNWYAGVQLFRYYAPLPYYGLLAVYYAAGDVFAASSFYIFLCALLGSLSFLLYTRWIGIFPATLGGILFSVLPENVRVAFSEGNIPRVLAAALLPLTLYVALRVTERGGHRKIYVLLLALLMCAVVLTHAMMAAIFLVSLSLFCCLFWLLGGSDSRGLFSALFGMVAGLLLSGLWFLPSLTGGITEVDEAAQSASEAAARFPVAVSFNPLPRLGNPEIFYIGFGLGLSILIGIVFWRRLNSFSRALLLVGTITTLVTTTFFSPFYASLPFHYLFYPTRFSTFASFALLLALVTTWSRLAGKARWLASALLLISALDFSASTRLIHLNPMNEGVLQASRKLRDLAGWRVAAADLSRLGSSPSYLLTEVANREQIFGWGYQGARLASNLSAINYAMDRGHFDYALDRLDELGTDDVLLLNGVMHADGFDDKLVAAGFQHIPLDDRLTLFHKDGAPRAFIANYDVLGIGGGAQNLAYLFPKISSGYSSKLDAYDAAYLARFKTLVLSRFSWDDRDRAERMIADYARAGGQVLVDLTGSPLDVLSRRPKFLGVYGEPLQLRDRIVLSSDSGPLSLLPFSDEEGPWRADTPQGLDRDVITFDYAGLQGVALGYKDFGAGRVWFTGLNLPYHAMLTRDPAAISILREVTGLNPGEVSQRENVLLQDYRANQDGYAFTYDAPGSQQIVLPVPAIDGVALSIDGKPATALTVDNLVSLNTLPGQHRVTVQFQPTRIYAVGLAASLFSILILLAYLMGVPSFVILRVLAPGISLAGAQRRIRSKMAFLSPEHNRLCPSPSQVDSPPGRTGKREYHS